MARAMSSLVTTGQQVDIYETFLAENVVGFVYMQP